MVERRRFKRWNIRIPLSLKLLGMGKDDHLIKAQTINISFDGILIEIPVFLEDDCLLIHRGDEPVKLAPFLVLNEKIVELHLKAPPMAQMIRAIGKVVWYEIGSRGKSYHFMMGIALEKMGDEDGEKWVNLVGNIFHE